MKNIKVNGIVIAENNMGDFDKMLTILTPNLGKIGCSAKGSRRPKSLLLSGTQFLCFGEYMMYKGSNTYNINSCETIEVFYNLRTDLDKLNSDLERKMDDKGNWFLRFDKNDALDEIWTILDKGDAIHLKVKIAAFPAKKQIAVDKVREAILND